MLVENLISGSGKKVQEISRFSQYSGFIRTDRRTDTRSTQNYSSEPHKIIKKMGRFVYQNVQIVNVSFHVLFKKRYLRKIYFFKSLFFLDFFLKSNSLQVHIKKSKKSTNDIRDVPKLNFVLIYINITGDKIYDVPIIQFIIPIIQLVIPIIIHRTP